MRNKYDKHLKTLIIDFMYPLPENIGRRMRTMNFVRFFKSFGHVDILYFYKESKEVESSDIFLKEYFIQHPSFGIKETTWYKEIKDRGKRILEKRPWLITEWLPQSLHKYISMIEEGNYDIILSRYIYDTYPLFCLSEKFKRRVIIDFDDVLSMSLYNYYSKYGNSIYSRMKNKTQKYFLADYEKRCLKFGAALFTSKYDQSIVVGRENDCRSYVIPNVFPHDISLQDIEYCGYQNRNVLLFVGALDYGPNIHGFKWFIDSIFRNIHKQTDIEKLIVVGRQPTVEIKTLCSSISNIELHSDVPDVKPFYQKSGIVVVPILTGGGTRIKILEAGAVGRPILATPMGAQGLDVSNGKDLFFFTDKSTFIQSYTKLKDKDIYDNIVNNMRYLVKDQYSPESFNRKMTEVIQTLN